MDINCIVDIASREVSFQENYKIAAYDHNVDVIRFSIEPIEDFSLNTSSIKIAAQGPNKARHDYAVDPSTVQIEEETGYITFDWPIPAGVTEMPIGTFKYGDRGQLIFAVCAEIISGDTVSKAWHSDDGIITVVAHLEPESGGGEDPEEEATNAQKIGQLQTATAILQREINGIASGTPPTADSTDDMDHEVSTVYINTTDGKWYYWNGTVWVPGGVYGGATTSTTFNQPGVPADDFAVGEALAEKADADDVDAIDDRVTALESGGSGLSEDGKQALLAIARSVIYTGPNGQELYNALYNAFYPPANLVGITAVYTQSGIVTTASSLDSLKKDLVVNAVYSDSSTAAINGYVLSGTLVNGTSTITVTYSGKTTTFTVNVIEALYMLPESTVFDGTNYIDTEVKLASVDRSYTIMLTETNGQNSTAYPVFHCMTESSPYPGLAFQKLNYNGYAVAGYSRNNVQTAINPEINNTNKVVFRHEAGSQYLYVDYATNGVRGEQLIVDNGGTFAQSDNNLLIGCYQTTNGDKGRFWKGIVSDFVILSNVIDDNAVTEYLGV